MSWIHPLHAYVEPPLDHRASKDAAEHPSREQCLPPQAPFQDQEVLPRAAVVPPPRRCPRCSSGRRGAGFLLAGLVMVGLLVKEVSVRLVWWRGLLLCFQVCWQPVGWGWRSDVKKVEGGIWTPFSGCTCSRSPESSLLLAFKGSKAMVNPCKSWKGKESKSWYFSCIFSFGSILTAPVEQRRDCASVPVFLQEVVWPRAQVPLNNKISRRVQLSCFSHKCKALECCKNSLMSNTCSCGGFLSWFFELFHYHRGSKIPRNENILREYTVMRSSEAEHLRFRRG